MTSNRQRRWTGRLAAAVVGGVACAVAPSSAGAALAFQEAGGQVVMEAEHYDTTVPRNSQEWALESSQSGASGTAYLGALPDTGVTKNTGYVTGSPEVVYHVQFTQPGTYDVWIRAFAVNGYADSVHAGLDGVGPATADRMRVGTGSWRWSRNTMDKAPATLSVSSPGVHTLHVWMREDGLRLDKILLRTSSSSTAPSGTGPAESPRITVGGDTTPPAIAAVSATTITSSGAAITWTTNEAATSQVNAGTTTSYGQTTSLDSTLVTSHSVTLSGLTAGTLYHYRVRSKDAAGNEAVSADATFTTSAAGDTAPPSGSVTINNGAAGTNHPTVTLTLSATDNSGTVSQMQCSNDGTTYSTPEAYATSKTWTLSSGDGMKTVYVKFKDAAGNWMTAPASDTIALDTTPPAIAITSPVDGAVLTAP